MANEHLSLPTGLSAEDYTLGGDSLLDYTPPNVQWQAPLASMGENVYANYVKTSPGLLEHYNRRLALPTSATGSLPMEGGRPQSMASWGLQHWQAHPETHTGPPEDWTRFRPGDEGYTPGALWSDPGRSPYIGYGGGVAEGIGTGGGPLSATGGVPSGMELAYPVWSYYGDYSDSDQYDENEYYHAGAAYNPFRQYYTQETDLPYFQYAPGDPSALYEGNQQLRVGQAYVPTGDYSGVFSF
jgi:hypothetical protein